jgi:Ca2+-binding EF-hand superfamily protein
MNNSKLIPQYRIKQIMKLYSIFNDKFSNEYNLEYRKTEFKKIIKLKYKWFTNSEYNYIYNLIKENEYNHILNFKKIEIEEKYKNDLIKLFIKFDDNDNNSIDIDEFKAILSKINCFTEEKIYEIFKEADLNGDSQISIDEFIIFLAKNDELTEKLKSILDCKFELKKRNDKRTLLFNNFPGSPLKVNWRPSLSNLNPMEFIRNNI